MNHLLVTFALVTVATMSVFPVGIGGTDVVAPTPDSQSTELEPPHALPLAVAGSGTVSAAAASAPDASASVATAAAAAQPQLNNDLGEIWQEDDREVLIRNARRAKDNNGQGSGAAAAGAAGGAGGSAAAAGKKGGKGEKKKTQRGGQSAAKAKSKAVATADQSVKSDAKIPQHCRYTKSPWSDCDVKTNTRSRTLSLKRGDDCVPTRTIQKKCKKACRYEKGTWTECSSGQMSRSDRLKTASDPSCQQTRDVTKNCNQGKANKGDKKDRPAKKEKGQRKGGRA